MSRKPHIVRIVGALGGVGCLALPATSYGETQRSFQVTATIEKGCIISTDGSAQLGRIDFGTVAGTARGSTDTALMSGAGAGIAIECTPGTNVSLTADAGQHGSNGMRQMGLNGGSASLVAYQLYADGSSTPWTNQVVPLSFAEGATARSLPVIGRAALTGSMAAGRYSDTVVVTVRW